MPDTEYKRRELQHRAPVEPTPYNVRGGATLERWPFRQVLRSQDTTAESPRRIVASQQMQGQTDDWLVPETDPEAQASQTHPKKNSDREVWRTQFSMAPGTVLESRSIYIPAGMTQEFVGSLWEPDGASGEVRWGLTWDNGAATDTSTVTHEHEGSPLDWGKQPNSIGGVWSAIKYDHVPLAVPDDSDWSTNAEAAKWSEWTTVTAICNHRGSPRSIHCCLSELPRLHVDDHDNASDSISVHGYPKNGLHPDAKPQTDTADGATYEDHRFGTTRALKVARHQADRYGPIIFSWSPYMEGPGGAGIGGNPAGVEDADYPPTFSTTSATDICIWDTGITAWAVDAPGFAMPGHYAKRWKECDPEQILPGGAEACIPVRVCVYASQSAGTGTITLQTTARSKLIWEITGAIAGWHTFTGFIECSRAGDDTAINAMIFVASDGTNDLEFGYTSVHFGDFAQN